MITLLLSPPFQHQRLQLPHPLRLAGKWPAEPPIIASVGFASVPHCCLLSIQDSLSGKLFLIDMGAQVSIVPSLPSNCVFPCPLIPPSSRFNQRLPYLGLLVCHHRAAARLSQVRYCTPLLYADVSYPLLRADFLRRHHLLVNVSNRCLLDARHLFNIPSSPTHLTCGRPLRLHPFLLPRSLTQPTFSSPPHGVQHCIPTTSQPVFCHSAASPWRSFAWPSRSSPPCWTLASFAPPTASGPPHFTWCPRPMVSGDLAVTTAASISFSSPPLPRPSPTGLYFLPLWHLHIF